MRPAATSVSAPVNRILPLSVVDGPGARAAVFVQGCNLACPYCHNPETQQLCRHCGLCVPGCPAAALSVRDGLVLWDSARCTACDACLSICPHRASPRVRRMTAEEVMAELRPNRGFLRGITVSGGECMLYPDFLTELFALARAAGLGTLLDSNGTVPFAAEAALLRVTDGVLLDVKAWDADVYRRVTGSAADVAVLRDNLVLLARAGQLAELRHVVTPGRTDSEAVLDGVAGLLGAAVADIPLKLMAFRRFGVRGPLADAPSPPPECMAALADRARLLGFTNITVV